MKINSEGGMDLSDDERYAVALWLAAENITDDYGGVEWESVPNLAEHHWELLDAQLRDIARQLKKRAVSFPGIDPQYIIQELTR